MLRIAALAELVSLAFLLLNLATVHWAAVASLLGPTHGCAYLFVIGATLRESRAVRVRLLSLVPGLGGLLVTRRLRQGQAPAADAGDEESAAVRPG
jgi:hypothetical protein